MYVSSNQTIQNKILKGHELKGCMEQVTMTCTTDKPMLFLSLKRSNPSYGYTGALENTISINGKNRSERSRNVVCNATKEWKVDCVALVGEDNGIEQMSAYFAPYAASVVDQVVLQNNKVNSIPDKIFVGTRGHGGISNHITVTNDCIYQTRDTPSNAQILFLEDNSKSLIEKTFSAVDRVICSTLNELGGHLAYCKTDFPDKALVNMKMYVISFSLFTVCTSE